MKRPNLFIAGAPKCGTTAMAQYLRTHPAIFFSDPKEPAYWAEDLPAMRRRIGITTRAAYESLFSAATDRHTYLGEGTTLYLYSQTAIKSIMAYQPAARFVVMIRRPTAFTSKPSGCQACVKRCSHPKDLPAGVGS